MRLAVMYKMYNIKYKGAIIWNKSLSVHRTAITMYTLRLVHCFPLLKGF